MACMKEGFGSLWWEQKCLAWCFARYSCRQNSSKIYITPQHFAVRFSNDICQDEDETPKISTAYVRQMQLSSNMFGVALGSLTHHQPCSSCGDLRSQCRGETRGGP